MHSTTTSNPKGVARSNRSTLRQLLRGHEGNVGGIALTATVSGFAEAAVLAAVAQIAAALISNADHVQADIGPFSMNVAVGTLIWVAGIAVVARLGLLIANVVMQARLGSEVQRELRDRLFAAFTRASWSVQSRDAEGHLQEMLTSQALQATWGTLQIAVLISALFTFVVLIISAMLLNPLAAALVVVVAVLLTVALRPLSALGQRRSKELSKSQMDYARGVGEAVRMAEESHVFGVADRHRASLESLVDVTKELAFRAAVVNRLAPTLFQGLIYLTVVAGLAAIYLTDAGNVASLGAVVLLLIRGGTYGQQMQGAYQLLRQALPFVERIQGATASYEADCKKAGADPLPAITTISFRGVSYAYPIGAPASSFDGQIETPVLSDVSFSVSKGETIGVIGPSGAGKSTLVQLLLQLRSPDQGEYLLNGIPADKFAAENWHRQVAYVPQEPRLLHASVAENIRYYREIDDTMVQRAAKLARIHDEIIGWKQGYDTIVGPRADSVSGGQQQRICLARALAANPTLLVLDEPTSALDPRSESLIQESLTELANRLTIFIVTHRMPSLAVCDKVMVIAENGLDGFDTSQALERTNAYYRTALQFTSGATSDRQAAAKPSI